MDYFENYEILSLLDIFYFFSLIILIMFKSKKVFVLYVFIIIYNIKKKGKELVLKKYIIDCILLNNMYNVIIWCKNILLFLLVL